MKRKSLGPPHPGDIIAPGPDNIYIVLSVVRVDTTFNELQIMYPEGVCRPVHGSTLADIREWRHGEG